MKLYSILSNKDKMTLNYARQLQKEQRQGEECENYMKGNCGKFLMSLLNGSK